MCDKSRIVLILEDRRKVILECEKEIYARKLAEIFRCGKTPVSFNIGTVGNHMVM